MSRTLKGTYIVKNPDKYVGNSTPVYRSSWELKAMQLFDTHPGIVQWASEPLKIPYFNPITNSQSVYIPDFLIVYVDKNGIQHSELVEIKPKKETFVEAAKSKQDKIRLAINSSKWTAAAAFCKRNGIDKFRVINEENIFKL